MDVSFAASPITLLFKASFAMQEGDTILPAVRSADRQPKTSDAQLSAELGSSYYGNVWKYYGTMVMFENRNTITQPLIVIDMPFVFAGTRLEPRPHYDIVL